MGNWVYIEPLDRVIVRDGRPFGERNYRLHTLPWPAPSTLAGAVRTAIGTATGTDDNRFSASRAQDLKEIAVWGPFLVEDDHVYLPAPRDAWVAQSEDGRFHVAGLRPVQPLGGEGTDLGHGWRLVLPPRPDKPAHGPAFWSLEAYSKWMATDSAVSTFSEEADVGSVLAAYLQAEPDVSSATARADAWFRALPEIEWRTHVRIDPSHGRAADGQLFVTSGLRLAPNQQLLCAVDTADWDRRRPMEAFPKSFDTISGLGGERGLARFLSRSGLNIYPETWPEKSSGLRMVLVTPALFQRGWLPGWLDPTDYTGVIPGTEVHVRLRSGVIDRWRPLSGWDLQRRRPKPMRRMVPAGSVYFFEVLDWGGSSWKDLWFKSLADDPQDQRDGFGVVVCGVWAPHE